jgi:hypothetical protein
MKYKKLPTLDFIENLRFPYRTITPTILILTLLTCTAYTGTFQRTGKPILGWTSAESSI